MSERYATGEYSAQSGTSYLHDTQTGEFCTENGRAFLNRIAAALNSQAQLVEALQGLFDAGMVTCMMWDGKDDQIEAIEKAKQALAAAGVGND